MKNPEATTAVAKNRAEMPSEVSSRLSTSSAKSKYSFRLFFFTALSILVCAGALANVAMASTPAGEDQYLEQPPSGGGNSGSGNNGANSVDTNGDGTITQAEVKKAAEKNKKKHEKNSKDGDGSTKVTGAATSTNTTPPAPPATTSVATAAKLGPFDRNTGLAIIALVLVIGGGALVLNQRKPPVPGGSSGAGTPTS